MPQSGGLLMYDSLARLPSPFIIHPDWKDETDSGSDMCHCYDDEQGWRFYVGCRQEKKKWKWSDSKEVAFFCAVGKQKINGWTRREADEGWGLWFSHSASNASQSNAFPRCTCDTRGPRSYFLPTHLLLDARDQLIHRHSGRRMQCGPWMPEPRLIRLKTIGSNVILRSTDLIEPVQPSRGLPLCSKHRAGWREFNVRGKNLNWVLGEWSEQLYDTLELCGIVNYQLNILGPVLVPLLLYNLSWSFFSFFPGETAESISGWEYYKKRFMLH